MYTFLQTKDGNEIFQNTKQLIHLFAEDQW